MAAKISLELKPGSMPNFIMVDCRGNDDRNDYKINVGRLTDEEREDYIKLWSDSFRAHHVERRRKLEDV